VSLGLSVIKLSTHYFTAFKCEFYFERFCLYHVYLIANFNQQNETEQTRTCISNLDITAHWYHRYNKYKTKTHVVKINQVKEY